MYVAFDGIEFTIFSNPTELLEGLTEEEILDCAQCGIAANFSLYLYIQNLYIRFASFKFELKKYARTGYSSLCGYFSTLSRLYV